MKKTERSKREQRKQDFGKSAPGPGRCSAPSFCKLGLAVLCAKKKQPPTSS